MRIVVSGGTGFIGSHVLKQLNDLPTELIAIRRNHSRPRIGLGKEPFWLDKSLDLIECSDFDGAEVLLHLASVGVSPRTASWQDLFYWNVDVMINLMVRAKKAGIRRVIMAGSFAEYGLSANHYDYLPVDAPLLPTSPYASSKAAGFIAAFTYAIENKIELCYLRIFSAFGEGQHEENFWPSLRTSALSGQDFPMTSGEQIRDYIPVEDVASVIVNAVNRNDILPGIPLVKNVGSGKPVTMRNFAEEWWSRFGANGKLLLGAKPYRPNEPMRYVPLLSEVQFGPNDWNLKSDI